MECTKSDLEEMIEYLRIRKIKALELHRRDGDAVSYAQYRAFQEVLSLIEGLVYENQERQSSGVSLPQR